MMNTINQSYHINNNQKGNNNIIIKSGDKLNVKEVEKDIKNVKIEYRTIIDTKKNNNSQKRITSIDNKKEGENKDNKITNNFEQRELKIKKEIKQKKDNKSILENKDNNESKEIIKDNNKGRNKENSNNKINKENKDNNTNTNNENNTIINLPQQIINIPSKQKSVFITEEKIKYFDNSKINNVQIPKDYINIIYYNLLQEEEKLISPMPVHTYMSKQPEINDKMRSILVDWLIDVHFKFGFTDETLFMTISIIDRYLSVCQITRSNFQLLGITALMIACKHEEIDLPKIDDFIYITDNAYKKYEVIKMENDVLSKLNFSFLYPSPIKFYEYLSLNFNFDKKQHLMGKYLMESFLLDVKNCKYKPSIISCACTYIVMKFFKMKNYQESYNKKFYNLDNNYEKYTEHNIKECAKDICLLVDNINKTNYQACVKKYSKPELEKVAIIIMNN